jgi:hypothetical protein
MPGTLIVRGGGATQAGKLSVCKKLQELLGDPLEAGPQIVVARHGGGSVLHSEPIRGRLQLQHFGNIAVDIDNARYRLPGTLPSVARKDGHDVDVLKALRCSEWRSTNAGDEWCCAKWGCADHIIRKLAFDGSKNASPTLLWSRRCLRMPRYYFHVRRGQVTVLDHEGAELVSLAEAKMEAVRRGQEILTRDGPTHKGTIIIADDSWRTVDEVPF